MKNTFNRRRFLSGTAVLPLVAAGGFLHPERLFSQTPVNRIKGSKLKVSLNIYSFSHALRSAEITLDEVLEFCAKLGFDAVDPTAYFFPGYPQVPNDSYANDFKRKTFLLGLDISGTGVKNDFTVPDKSKREADIAYTQKWIDFAARIGAPVVRIFTGKGVPEGYTREQVIEWMIDDIRHCVEYGKRRGVMVAIQNHNEFLKTAADVKQILKAINSDWFGLVLDIGSFRTTDPYREISEMAPYAVNWQIKEKLFVYGKEQKTDVKKTIQIIKESGYRGYIPIETLGPGDPKVKVTRFYEEVKNAL